jgi:16S rRNA (guanine966-N2)-methyltransferase
MSRRKRSSERPGNSKSATPVDKPLRIIAGRFRNRPIRYTGDPRTRPMKDRVREALFNLVGPRVEGKHAIDLFAGTGALGLEAISRGAARATFIERHFPTVRVIRENIASLEIESQCQVFGADTFLWLRQQRARDPQLLAGEAWLVLCSPPFDFYLDRLPQMRELLTDLRDAAPPDSLLVVESDQRFDFAAFEDLGDWDIRAYPPAILGLLSGPPLS